MIIDSLGTGGAEVSLKTLTRAMANAGHKVVILVVRNDIVLEMDPGVEVRELGYRKYRFLPSLYINALRLKKVVSALEKDCGKFHLKVANLTLSQKLSCTARLKNIYYCLHEDIVVSNLEKRKGLSRYFRMKKIQKLLNNKNVITVSDGIKSSLESIKGLRCKSVTTIYNPVDISSIVQLSKKENPYADLNYIVHVGRFSAEKRHDILLEAFSRAKLDHKLILVGDGTERENIEATISRLGIGDRVIITGFIENPYPIMRDAILLILSSDYEGFGVVLAEALCLETAVASSDSRSGPREIMSSSLSEYLAPTGDVNALADRMKKAIADAEKGIYPFKAADLERFLPEKVIGQYVQLGDS